MNKVFFISVILSIFSSYGQETPAQMAKRVGSVAKSIPDTIVDENVYLDKEVGAIAKDSRFNKSKFVNSVKVENGLFYVAFTAIINSNFNDAVAIRDGMTVPVSALVGVTRSYTTAAANPRKSFVYVTPATNGKYQSIKTNGWSLGLLNIPFKIRPATDTIHSETKADVKNIMLALGRGSTSERYFSNGTTSKHKLFWSVLIGASVESLTVANTLDKKFKGNPSNQVYLSTAFGVGYAYNEKITVAFIPIGADTGFSDTSKKWIYNGNYWWGFGVGIDMSGLKLF